MVAISVTEADAGILREVLEAKLTDLGREISHTDSHRFRDTLYQVEAAVRRFVDQLPVSAPTNT